MPNTPLPLLESLNCQYAFYARPSGGEPVFSANQECFLSASMIKVPILLAWVHLERAGELDRAELCDLDVEPQIQGAGFSWLLRARHIPYQDVLLMMIALSDNLCTNLAVRRIGLERLEHVLHGPLGLSNGTRLERKLMDYAARAEGKDNWISAQDCIRLFDLFRDLTETERAWVEPMLEVQQNATLLARDIPRDTVTFLHKTGNIPGVLHDWGWSERADIFLLTNGVTDEDRANTVFGQLGKMYLTP